MAGPSSLPRIISVTARQTFDAFSAHKVLNVFCLLGHLTPMPTKGQVVSGSPPFPLIFLLLDLILGLLVSELAKSGSRASN